MQPWNSSASCLQCYCTNRPTIKLHIATHAYAHTSAQNECTGNFEVWREACGLHPCGFPGVAIGLWLCKDLVTTEATGTQAYLLFLKLSAINDFKIKISKTHKNLTQQKWIWLYLPKVLGYKGRCCLTEAQEEPVSNSEIIIVTSSKAPIYWTLIMNKTPRFSVCF